MGVRTTAKLLTPLFLLYIANAQAAPMLRLTGNKVGPIAVPVGGTATFAPALRASNAGDGTLHLTLTSSAPWLTAAPRILRVGIGDYGVILNQDGSLVAPVGLVPGSHPAKAGHVLVVYGIDLGQTTPAATTGAAAMADPLLKIPNYTIELGNAGWFSPPVVVPAQFAGLSPGSVGLYQVNFQVLANAPKGDTTATVVLGDNGPSNRVVIAIQ